MSFNEIGLEHKTVTKVIAHVMSKRIDETVEQVTQTESEAKELKNGMLSSRGEVYHVKERVWRSEQVITGLYRQSSVDTDEGKDALQVQSLVACLNVYLQMPRSFAKTFREELDKHKAMLRTSLFQQYLEEFKDRFSDYGLKDGFETICIIYEEEIEAFYTLIDYTSNQAAERNRLTQHLQSFPTGDVRSDWSRDKFIPKREKVHIPNPNDVKPIQGPDSEQQLAEYHPPVPFGDYKMVTNGYEQGDKRKIYFELLTCEQGKVCSRRLTPCVENFENLMKRTCDRTFTLYIKWLEQYGLTSINSFTATTQKPAHKPLNSWTPGCYAIIRERNRLDAAPKLQKGIYLELCKLIGNTLNPRQSRSVDFFTALFQLVTGEEPALPNTLDNEQDSDEPGSASFLKMASIFQKVARELTCLLGPFLAKKTITDADALLKVLGDLLVQQMKDKANRTKIRQALAEEEPARSVQYNLIISMLLEVFLKHPMGKTFLTNAAIIKYDANGAVTEYIYQSHKPLNDASHFIFLPQDTRIYLAETVEKHFRQNFNSQKPDSNLPFVPKLANIRAGELYKLGLVSDYTAGCAYLVPHNIISEEEITLMGFDEIGAEQTAGTKMAVDYMSKRVNDADEQIANAHTSIKLTKAELTLTQQQAARLTAKANQLEKIATDVVKVNKINSEKLRDGAKVSALIRVLNFHAANPDRPLSVYIKEIDRCKQKLKTNLFQVQYLEDFKNRLSEDGINMGMTAINIIYEEEIEPFYTVAKPQVKETGAGKQVEDASKKDAIKAKEGSKQPSNSTTPNGPPPAATKSVAQNASSFAQRGSNGSNVESNQKSEQLPKPS